VEGLIVKQALAILGWVGVVLVVAAVVLRFTQPDLLVWSQRLAIAGLVTTLLYTLGQWREIARSFQGKNVRYGSMTAGSVVLVLAILVGINWISNRQNTRWDLTSNQQFSLSEQSIKVVRELQAPVTIRAFHATGQKDALADRLGEYADLSNNVQVEYFDVDASPIEAQKYEVQQYGTLIFDYNGRTERTTMSNEQDITNALIKVVTGAAKKIYFLQGHGERDSAGTDPRGFGQIAEALKGDNFETATLALAQTGTVPDDANVVVIAGPTTDLLAGEIEQLKAYLDRGGKLFVMIDPPGRDQAQALPNLIGLVGSWGFQLGDNMVLDMSGMGRAIGTGPEVPLAMRYPGHPITEGFRVMTAFPLSRSVSAVEGGVDGKLPVAIVETSPQSWGESDIKGLYATGKPGFDPKTDKQGPIAIGAAVSAAAPNAPAGESPDAPKPEARMVVFGDSDFASNGALGIQGNRDLVLNTANWLAQQENLIAIRPKDPADRRVQLTEDQMNRVFWLALGIFPLALIGIGVRVWWTRR
jgi:ABC-type uncharacterized transport system involved in gliding motility auxiliary subunit